MKPVPQIGLRAAARAYTPLVALFAASLAAAYPAGSGVGLLAGLAFALLLALHMLVYGAAAARAALPPMLARGLIALGLIAGAVAAGAPNWAYAPQAGEVSLFLLVAAGFALVLQVLIGRAPTLRDEAW